MTVPTAVQFSTILSGQAYSNDLITYFIKTGPTTGVDLATGTPHSFPDPTAPFTVYPAARLILG